MQQHTLTHRLQKTRERCLSVSGGIKAVATRMGKAQNTLHNWFKGVTEPTIDDVELLVAKVGEMEAEDSRRRQQEEQRLNAVLGEQGDQLANVLAA